MKKLVILVTVLLIYTSIFPMHLLASSQTDDDSLGEDITEQSDSAINDEETEIVDEAPPKESTETDDKFTQQEAVEDEEIVDQQPEGESAKDLDAVISNDSNTDNTPIEDEQSKTVKEVTESETPEGIDKKNSEVKEQTEKTDTESEEKNKEQKELDQYNEFGVKIGTIIYGEDISKLNEAELKYIPKAWREGKFVEEHPGEESDSIRIKTTYPDVNSYIYSKKISAAKTEYNHKSIFEEFNYRNGFGKVEGVVAHETANNNSTITQEIDYMSRNHNNAFVHAFVDHSRIIEIHPPDYGAWGAGRYANQRFVHVELVRVDSFDKFARSINNYSDYIASILYEYDLGVTSAEGNGRGTLWSHNAVSKFLGGTTHVDPHGYFTRWGYNWNDFVQLVTLKYNKLSLNKENTSKLGHIRSTNSRIYDNPSNPYEYKKAGSKYTNAVYYIKKQAKLNGTTYYLLSEKPSSTSGKIGWIKAQDADVHAHKGIDNKPKTFTIKGTGKAYYKAWGGSKNAVYNLSSYKGKSFRVNLTESVGSNIWFRGILNGKQVWVHSSYVTAKDVKESSTSLLGHLRGTAKIYKDIKNPSTFTSANGKYTNQVYYIKKEAITNNEKYFLISKSPSSVSGLVGWVKAEEITVHKHTGIDNKAKKFYIKGNGSGYNKAWGGSKNLVYSNLALYVSEEFKVNLTEKVGNNTWYRGKLNGKTVWLHSSYVISKPEVSTSTTSKLGHLRSSAKIYTDLVKFSSKSVNGYTNAVYYVKKQATVKGTTYYLISMYPSSTKEVIGWVKSSDLDSRTHKTVDHKPKTFYVKGTGKAYSKTWGGLKNLVYGNMSKYKYQKFKVNLTEKVGNNTWYRGNLNGKTVWLHSSYVTTKKESSTSRLGHLRGNAKIYPNLHNQNSYKMAKDGYTNAVYYVKKQADINGQRYYLISTAPSSTKGTVGWVKSRELDSRTHKTVDSDTKTLTVKGTGKAYSNAWGGPKNLVYNSLKSYSGGQIKINLTEKVGENTWYRGKLNGKTVWIHSSYLTNK